MVVKNGEEVLKLVKREKVKFIKIWFGSDIGGS